MKKFLVLYQSTVPASEQMRNVTPEQAKDYGIIDEILANRSVQAEMASLSAKAS